MKLIGRRCTRHSKGGYIILFSGSCVAIVLEAGGALSFLLFYYSADAFTQESSSFFFNFHLDSAGNE